MEEACWVFDFIAENVLVSLQWKMNHIAYIMDDSSLEDKTDEE